MDFTVPESHGAMRQAVVDLCSRFPGEYWRRLEEQSAYPEEFVATMMRQGWLSMLIPVEFGGAGLGLLEAGIVLEEVNRSGGNASACHAQMYTMGVLLRHGSTAMKERYLPALAAGALRLQAFAITEPDAGSDTSRISTRAVGHGDEYVISGRKIFISRVEQSDLMLLLARTDRDHDAASRTEGLSLFLLDLRSAGSGVSWSRIPIMFNQHTYEVQFDQVVVPRDCLVGEEGAGFRYVIDGWNAERILLASEAVGDGRYFIEVAASYATQREVFGRPIGANQGVQFPLADAYADVQAASLMRYNAASLFDQRLPCGPEANMAKLLTSKASWKAANAALTAMGGYGFAREYDVERKFRETKLLETAPVSNNLVLAYIGHRVLNMPRSY